MASASEEREIIALRMKSRSREGKPRKKGCAMAYLAKDNDGQEVLFASCPHYNEEEGAWIAEDGKVVEVRRAFEMLNLEYNGKPIEI